MSVMKKTATTFHYSGRKTLTFITISLIHLIVLLIAIKASSQVKKTVNKNLLLNKVSDTLPKAATTNTAVLTPQVSFQTNAQASKTIDKRIIHRNFQNPDTAVKFQVIKNGAVVRTETAKANEIELAAGEQLVLHPKKEITPADRATVTKLKSVSSIQFTQADLKVLPEVTIETRDSGARQISYQLYFFPYEPFTYNDSLRKFQSKMGFFFLRSDSLSAVNPIDPVNIIVTSNDLKQVNPRPLQINHLNFPASDVDLAGDNLSDSVEIRVITASKPDGYQTFLKIKPVLEISTNRISLQGYGIQKIPVEVRLIGSNSPDSVTVNLSASKGTVTPTAVTLRYNTPQTVYLTSEGTGKTLLSAKSSNLESNDLHLSYAFPWYFLLASILGGVLGGFTKYYAGRKKNFSIRPIIGGVLAGLVGAMAYYALGITLLNFKLTAEMNEFAVLALSALFAYFGIPKSKAT
jgi:hypothetical protein